MLKHVVIALLQPLAVGEPAPAADDAVASERASEAALETPPQMITRQRRVCDEEGMVGSRMTSRRCRVVTETVPAEEAEGSDAPPAGK